MGEVRTVCSYCGVGCGISVTTSDAGVGHPLTIAKVAGDRAHPDERRAPVHQGCDPCRADAGSGPHDLGARAPRARGAGRAGCAGRCRDGCRDPSARDPRGARTRRHRDVRVGPDEHGGAVPLEQAREGVSAGHPHRVELAPVHGIRRDGLQAVARRRRPARLVRGLRPRRPVLRDRVEHGGLPSDPVPADGGPAQAGGAAHRRRPAPHDDGRPRRPLPADRPGHRPRAPQRPAAPARGGGRHRRGVHRRPHRRVGAHGGGPRRVPARACRGADRTRRGRHPHRRALDRRGRRVDDAVDDGTEPVHPRHVVDQRHLQPPPRHGRHLPAGKRAVLAHRPAERDGRARDGLHGAWASGAARRVQRAGPRVRRRGLGTRARVHPCRVRRRHHRHVPPRRRRRDQSGVDHLQQPGRLGREPQDGDRGARERRARHRPGRLHRDRHHRVRRHPAACHAVGGGGRRDRQQRPHPHARP